MTALLLTSIASWAKPSPATLRLGRSRPVAPPPVTVIDDAGTSYSVGLGTHNYVYEEAVMNEKSNFNGFVARVSHASATSVLKAVGELEFFDGRGRYDGAYNDGTPVRTGARTSYRNLRGLVGARGKWNADSKIFWYGGYATRFLHNKYEGPGSYAREATYTYLPLGFEWTRALKNRWEAGFGFEYDLFLGGTMKTHLSDLDSGLPDVEKTQSHGSGYRLTGTFTKALDGYALQIQPFFHRWNIADSERKPMGGGRFLVEPANSTTVIGSAFSVRF